MVHRSGSESIAPERADAATAEAGLLGRGRKSGHSVSEEGRIRIKRIYRAPRNSDGKRILVDRIWPRGMSKERARLDGWMKDVAPGDPLRKWFHANPERWDDFHERYCAELDGRRNEIDMLISLTRAGVVTLLYASADPLHNNAAVLRDYLRRQIDAGT